MTPKGLMFSEERYIAKLGCKMDFRNFPFDTQSCLFRTFLGAQSKIAILVKYSFFSDGPWDWICCGETWSFRSNRSF